MREHRGMLERASGELPNREPDAHRFDPSEASPRGTVANREQELKDAVADHEARVEMARRKVEVALAQQEELADDAPRSEVISAADQLATAQEGVQEAQRRLLRANAALSDALQAPPGTSEQTHEAGEEEESGLHFPNADAWLRNWMVPNWRRPHVNEHWCPKWWLHAEAVSRINALWRAWEYLRTDGATGVSIWWRDHADYHLTVLTSPSGPFARCGKRGHGKPHRHEQAEEMNVIANPAHIDEFIQN